LIDSISQFRTYADQSNSLALSTSAKIPKCLGLGETEEFGHKNVLRATSMKQMKKSSSGRISLFLVSLLTKKVTEGIDDFPIFSRTVDLPETVSEGNADPPIGRPRTE